MLYGNSIMQHTKTESNGYIYIDYYRIIFSFFCDGFFDQYEIDFFFLTQQTQSNSNITVVISHPTI